MSYDVSEERKDDMPKLENIKLEGGLPMLESIKVEAGIQAVRQIRSEWQLRDMQSPYPNRKLIYVKKEAQQQHSHDLIQPDETTSDDEDLDLSSYAKKEPRQQSHDSIQPCVKQDDDDDDDIDLSSLSIVDVTTRTKTKPIHFTFEVKPRIDESRFDKMTANIQPRVEITDKPLCALAHFLMHGHGKCDWASIGDTSQMNPTQWDAVILANTTLSYSVQYALFWLQNKECYSNLRLYHIVRCQCLLDKFERLIALLQMQWRGCKDADAELIVLRNWMHAQRSLTFDAVDTPFTYVPNPQPIDSSMTHKEWMSNLRIQRRSELTKHVLEVMRCTNSLASERQCIATYERVLSILFVKTRKTTVDLERILSSKGHARTMMAMLVSIDMRLDLHTLHMNKILSEKRIECIDWLVKFVFSGCSCLS